MATLKERIGGLRTFWVETLNEMRKTSWPGREELMQSTAVVIISVLLLSAFVGLCDRVVVLLLKVIIPSL